MTDEDKAYPKSSSGNPVALEVREAGSDGRRFSPSTARNKDAVADAFREAGLIAGQVLEIASGTGEHGAHLTGLFAQMHWTYSDIDPVSMESQQAWVNHEGHGRLNGPYQVDTTDAEWREVSAVDYGIIFCANMVHIAPFTAAEGLIVGAGRRLTSGGHLCLYGPYARSGEIAPSNARFSENLQRRDPSWGVRDLDLEIVPLAKDNGLHLDAVIEMPANNLFVVFQKA